MWRGSRLMLCPRLLSLSRRYFTSTSNENSYWLAIWIQTRLIIIVIWIQTRLISIQIFDHFALVSFFTSWTNPASRSTDYNKSLWGNKLKIYPLKCYIFNKVRQIGMFMVTWLNPFFFGTNPNVSNRIILYTKTFGDESHLVFS